MEITTDGVVVLIDEYNNVSIKSSSNKLDDFKPITNVLMKIENNQPLSQKEQKIVRLLCSLSVTPATGSVPTIAGCLSSANFALNTSVSSFDIPDEQASEEYQDEFDKIKQRTKLSTKGKSSYGPQRR